MSIENRLRRLEAGWKLAADNCPECGTPETERFPIAWGATPMCGTCGHLLLDWEAEAVRMACRDSRDPR